MKLIEIDTLIYDEDSGTFITPPQRVWINPDQINSVHLDRDDRHGKTSIQMCGISYLISYRDALKLIKRYRGRKL